MLRRARFCGALRLGNDIARNAFMTATHTLHSSTARRVLLVDDSKTERLLAERALAQDAYEVVTADSAQAALLALDGAGFNLIISDQRLPDLPGVALLGMVRETVVPAPPMLLLTSDDSARTRHAASHAGVRMVLTKPVTPSSLREIVSAHAAPSHTAPCTTLLNEGNRQAFFGGGLNLDEQRSLLARWRAGIAEQLDRLQGAAQSKDVRLWAQELHRLRGAAALCGALRLSAAAAGMETAPPSQASVTLLECINQDTNAALARRVGLVA
jgi:DNA-binding response OmpR family regulator